MGGGTGQHFFSMNSAPFLIGEGGKQLLELHYRAHAIPERPSQQLNTILGFLGARIPCHLRRLRVGPLLSLHLLLHFPLHPKSNTGEASSLITQLALTFFFLIALGWFLNDSDQMLALPPSGLSSPPRPLIPFFAWSPLEAQQRASGVLKVRCEAARREGGALHCLRPPHTHTHTLAHRRSHAPIEKTL